MKYYHLFPILFVLFLLSVSGCSKPEEWEMKQWYTQLSRYRDGDTKAFSIHIKTLEEEKIQKICDYYFNKYADDDHYLHLHFYDDRSFTPDYSKGIEFTEVQGEHLIARYFYNPFTGEKRLEFLQ